MTPDQFETLAAVFKKIEAQVGPHRDTIANVARSFERISDQHRQLLNSVQVAIKQYPLVLPNLQATAAAVAKFQTCMDNLPKMPPILAFPPIPRLPHSSSKINVSDRIVAPKTELSERQIGTDKEIERLNRENRNLKLFILGFGTEFPPDSWDSFDDYTELSEN